MRRKRISLFLLLIGSALFFSIASAQSNLTGGAEVYAEWVKNGWYHGKIGIECESGFIINFDDGDVKCCSLNEIVADQVPAESEVNLKSRVLAQWSDGRFYPGTVVGNKDGEYSISFDDGDKGKVTIEKLRLFKLK
jgi:hypothetical protein